MWYQITAEPDYLRADLFRQETAEHAQEFLAAVAAAVRRYGHSQIFIAVTLQNLYSKVGQSGCLITSKIWASYRDIESRSPGFPMSFRLSQQYIESLARQRGINIRSFRDESAVLLSFKDQRWVPDRRRAPEPCDGQERRHQDRSSQARRNLRGSWLTCPNGLKHSSAESREQIKAGFVKNYES